MPEEKQLAMHTRQAQPSLKERQRQEREALILQAAEEVLYEKGYYETSMDEIAARVGIAKGTIYAHFPGKEELVIALFMRNMQALIERAKAVIESESTPRAQLEALISFISNRLREKHLKGSIDSIYNSLDLKRLFMEKGNCMQGLWESLISFVTAILEEGKAIGEFNPELPTAIMAHTFFNLLSPRMYDHPLLGTQLSSEEQLKYLKMIFFNGINNVETK